MVKTESPAENSKQGFTIIEVMLVLAITGLMLVGIIAGTYSSIATQRYNDSVRSFSEFLRQVFAEVISPQSLSEGNSDEAAVYGKVVVFGANADSASGVTDSETPDTVYTATLVGSAKPPRSESGFMDELAKVGAKLFCGNHAEVAAGIEAKASTVDEYIPMWEAKINNTNDKTLRGTLIIARSPASGAIHTYFSDEVHPDLENECTPDEDKASTVVFNAIQGNAGKFRDMEVDFCIVSYNSRIVRDIRLAADAHNSSAINLVSADAEDDESTKDIDEGVRCQQR